MLQYDLLQRIQGYTEELFAQIDLIHTLKKIPKHRIGATFRVMRNRPDYASSLDGDRGTRTHDLTDVNRAL